MEEIQGKGNVRNGYWTTMQVDNEAPHQCRYTFTWFSADGKSNDAINVY